MGMSAAEFSRQISVPTNRVTQILNGRRSITGATALRLAHFFGTSAEFWLNLQSLYEIRLAQKKSGPAIRTLPTIKDFQNRGCPLGYGLKRKVIVSRYSVRITAAGSARTARIAGINVPSSEVIRHNAAAVEKVSVSAGSTPASRLCKSRAAM